MIYRVLMDGNDILNFQERKFVLLDPVVDTELNAAGSFEFTMPSDHYFYEDVNLLTSTIEVYEDENLIWYGRPTEIKTDFYKNKHVYCEGALAFFNDTVQRAHLYVERVYDVFETVIAAHNAQVSADRQFTVGEITVSNTITYWEVNYCSTFELLKKYCLNECGGYFFVRRENGVNYIDWLGERLDYNYQGVTFGANLLDLTSTIDMSSIVTCVLPLGATDMDTGEALTIKSVNFGSDVIDSDAVSTFGRITKVVTFSDIKDPDILYAAGEDYLTKQQFDNLVIECTAADLHFQNEEHDQFKVGQSVWCYSRPHLIDREFPLTKLSVRLDTAAKKITLGYSPKKKSLTQFWTETWEDEYDDEDPATEAEIEHINTQISGIQNQVSGLQNQVNSWGGDNWVHQIDGVTSNTGRVNFVTVT